MTDQKTAIRDGFVHEAYLYQCDEELLSFVVPFLRDAHEHGDVAVVNVDDRKANLLRSQLGSHAEAVQFVDGRWYTNPASAIREYLRCFESLASNGGGRTIRSVGELPAIATNGKWQAWRRYEAMINVVFEELQVWKVCLFDRTAIRPDVVSDVLCTHPRLTTPPGPHTVNELYTDPRDWLMQLTAPPHYDVERTPPLVTLVNPASHEARAAIATLAEGLSASDRDCLLVGVSEVVWNASTYGEPPVTLRAWASDGHVVVTVDDCGSGIDDPFVGLVEQRREMGAGGRGLWITHQLCSDVALINNSNGFRVRIVAGDTGDTATRSQ